MDFTFGIITDGNNDHFINEIIKSIENNNIPNYEIIIVGNTKIEKNDKIQIISFDESIKDKWITRKKNIIAENATFENIVLLHDYVKLEEDWYEGFLKFGNDFEWCINKIKTIDGRRFRDYTLFPYRHIYNYSSGNIKEYFSNHCLLPYDFINNIKINKYMYISGSYYVIKKEIALKYPLNESLLWGQGEDIELSRNLHIQGIIIKCNPFSTVFFLKIKESKHWEIEINQKELNYLIEYCNNE